MPESNKPKPVICDYHSLGLAWRGGSKEIELHCLTCDHSAAVSTAVLIDGHGPQALLVDVARRSRCRFCGRKGCHVQPKQPPAPEQTGYREHLHEEMGRCYEFIRWAVKQLWPAADAFAINQRIQRELSGDTGGASDGGAGGAESAPMGGGEPVP